jgi:hypothetical protein
LVPVVYKKKQKRAFNQIKNGISLAQRLNLIVRFITLTTSDIQFELSNFQPKQLNDNFEKLKQIIRRTSIIDLINMGYLNKKDLRYFYNNKKLGKTLTFEYFKVRTNEGNGVLHILYKGDYIPYNYLVDIWNDIHNSWNVNIKKINTDNYSAFRTSNYVVSQYLSNQDSSYQRSSQSWGWTIRGYIKKFYEFIGYCKSKYFYNPVKVKFYKLKGKKICDEVDIFKEWLDYLVQLLKPPDSTVQVVLEVF